MSETSATPSSLSDVPLPPGADEASCWGDWGHKFRIVYTPEQRIAHVTLCGSAIQWPDGTIDVGAEAPPLILVAGEPIRIGQARELAEQLRSVADTLEGWLR